MQIDSPIENVVGREGGYVNHPADKGGATLAENRPANEAFLHGWLANRVGAPS